ncbi:MAG: protein-disulfide reductase DsbD [Burkholderiales bacterium]|nr:protein-disulfide reductase DsbD [Burkholderiales bacterium]
MSRICALCITVWVLVWAWAVPVAHADDFLPPEQAFALATQVVGERTVRLHWEIAPGYYLYRERLNVQPVAQGGPQAPGFKPLVLPPAEQKWDTNFNKSMAVYKHALDVDVVLNDGASSAHLTVGWQGCAEAGLCYPPATETLAVQLPAQGAGGARQAPSASADDADAIASTLASGSLWRTAGMFWLAGLLLSFTPCVLPMVPILSSLIAGQKGPVSRRQGFLLSLAYSLGMALVYAAFGAAAGLAGEGLAAALQNPWVLGTFALLLSGLALSMFGFYELQMPSAIQSRATEWSNRFQGGSMVGVFLMGGVSALVVGPCVAAPLAGALVYISQTRDVWLGGTALFTMALGMSVPLLLVGLSAGSLLPRVGGWMERVKQVFGMMLLAVAIWMVSPVLHAAVHMLLWAAWLLVAAALLGLFGVGAEGAAPAVSARACGTGLVAVAAVLLVGAASGGQSVLQPLGHLRPMATAGSSGGAASVASNGAATTGHLKFERVGSVQALEAALAQARQQGQTVMLDFYADWCVACKELETFTFSNPDVQRRLQGVRLLQADVTNNSADDKALMKRFSLFGPPGMVFFDAQSAEVAHKVVGYQDAGAFLASVSRAWPHSGL